LGSGFRNSSLFVSVLEKQVNCKVSNFRPLSSWQARKYSKSIENCSLSVLSYFRKIKNCLEKFSINLSFNIYYSKRLQHELQYGPKIHGYFKDDSADATFREIRSWIGSCRKKSVLVSIALNNNLKNTYLWITSVNGISNFEFVIVSYKKMYLSSRIVWCSFKWMK